jgi:hypothetical protein
VRPDGSDYFGQRVYAGNDCIQLSAPMIGDNNARDPIIDRPFGIIAPQNAFDPDR